MVAYKFDSCGMQDGARVPEFASFTVYHLSAACSFRVLVVTFEKEKNSCKDTGSYALCL